MPRRLVVMGGGPVGCEMSQALRALGAREVTMPVSGDRLLEQAEPFADELLARSFEKPVPGGPVTVHTHDGSRVEADEILVAVGPIEVDASMRVAGVPGGWLYAVGDVNGRNLLTHMGKYQGRVCGDVIAARVNGLPDDSPRCPRPAPIASRSAPWNTTWARSPAPWSISCMRPPSRSLPRFPSANSGTPSRLSPTSEIWLRLLQAYGL